MDLVSKGLLFREMAPIKVWNLLDIGQAWVREDHYGEVSDRQPRPNGTAPSIPFH